MGIVAKQSGWNLVSGYLGTLLGALNTLVLFPATFPENPEMMGSIRWVLSTSLVISAFVHWGWPQAMVTWLPKLGVKVERKSFEFGRTLISWTLLALLALTWWRGSELVALLTNEPLSRDWSPWIWLLVAVYAFFELHAAVLIHNQRVVLPYVLKDSGRKLTITILLLGTMLGWLTFDHLVAGLLLIYSAMTVWVTLKAYTLLPNPSEGRGQTWERKPVVKYALTMVMTSTAAMMFGQLDIMMIGAWLSLAEVSQYAIALNFGLVVAMPMKAMNASLRPVISKMVAQSEWTDLKTLGLRSLHSQWFASSFIFLNIMAIAPWLLAWLPAGYQGGLNAIPWLAGAQLIHVLTGASGLAIVTSKMYRWGLYANSSMLVMALVMGWFWIPEHGVLGAAQVFFVAIFTLNLLKFIALHRLTGSIWVDVRSFKSILWTAVALVTLLFVVPHSYDGDLLAMTSWGWPALSVIGIAIWAWVGLVVFNLSDDLRHVVQRILKILPWNFG